MVGAGGRQRGYQKAGRVKKAGSKRAKTSKQSTESPTETNREKGSDRLEKRLAKQYSAVREEKSKAFVECVIRASCVISAMSDWWQMWLVQWWMGNAVRGWCAAVVWCKGQCGEQVTSGGKSVSRWFMIEQGVIVIELAPPPPPPQGAASRRS